MDTKGESMTVLRRDDARGLESKRTRGFVVGLTMAVIGLAAAFGISQLIDSTGTATAESPVATLQTQVPAYAQASQSPVATMRGEVPAYALGSERGAAMQGNIEALTRTGQAQQQAILERALEQGNAIQSRSAFEKAMGGSTWALVDEQAAIHGRTGTEPTSSVGATVSQPTADQVLAGIHGRTGYQPGVTTTAKPTVEQEHAAIEARTGVEQNLVNEGLEWSPNNLVEFHERRGAGLGGAFGAAADG
jgi:hypothetical protein